MEASSVIVSPRRRRKRFDSQEFLKYALINARKNRMRQENVEKSPKIKATSQNGFTFYYSVTDQCDEEDSSDEEEDFDEVFDHQNNNNNEVEQDSNLVSFDDFFSALNEDNDSLTSQHQNELLLRPQQNYQVNDALISSGQDEFEPEHDPDIITDSEANELMEELNAYMDQNFPMPSRNQDPSPYWITDFTSEFDCLTLE